MLGRVLFITSAYGGLPEGMVNALKRMQTDYVEVPIWRMTEVFNEYKPSTMIFFHHFLKEGFDQYVKEIQNINCHKIYWDWECPWEIDSLVKYHYLFGFILVQDKNSAQQLSNRANNKFIFLPHAADIDASQRSEDIAYEYRSDLCFIGAAYPSRVQFFREVLPQLKDYKVVIGGTGYEFLPNTNIQYVPQKAIIGRDYLLYTNGAKVVLNLHRGSEELTMNNIERVQASSPNNRFFEINMMGAFQMVDEIRPTLKDFYPNVISFSTPQDFLKKFTNYISDNSGRKQIAEQNRQHTLQFHTYEKRFEEIAKLI